MDRIVEIVERFAGEWVLHVNTFCAACDVPVAVTI